MPSEAIQINRAQLASVNRVFTDIKNGAPRVMVRALNKTASKAKTESSREIRKIVTLKAKTVNNAIKIQKANFKNLSAKLTISGRPLPLYAYGVRQTNSGVSVRVRKSKPIEKHKSAFIARMKSGHIGVFKRRGRSRIPIDEKAGPSIPAVFQFNNESLVTLHASDNLQTQLDREIAYMLSQIK